jgi:hypothetical protein
LGVLEILEVLDDEERDAVESRRELATSDSTTAELFAAVAGDGEEGVGEEGPSGASW